MFNFPLGEATHFQSFCVSDYPLFKVLHSSIIEQQLDLSLEYVLFEISLECTPVGSHLAWLQAPLTELPS